MNMYTNYLKPFWQFSMNFTHENDYKKKVLGIPRKYLNAELDKIDPFNESQVELINKLNEMERNPKKLAMIVNGINHSGKTHIACAAISYIARCDDAYIRGSEKYELYNRAPRYVNESDLLNRTTGYGKGYDWFTEYTDTSQFLIIDEFGSNQWSSLEARRIGQILNKRFNNGLQTVLLTNRNMGEMFELMSSDVKSRFKGCLHVTMTIEVDPHAQDEEESDVPSWLV